MKRLAATASFFFFLTYHSQFMNMDKWSSKYSSTYDNLSKTRKRVKTKTVVILSWNYIFTILTISFVPLLVHETEFTSTNSRNSVSTHTHTHKHIDTHIRFLYLWVTVILISRLELQNKFENFDTMLFQPMTKGTAVQHFHQLSHHIPWLRL